MGVKPYFIKSLSDFTTISLAQKITEDLKKAIKAKDELPK